MHAMMAQPDHISYAEFVSWEELAEAKHEYANGTIVAFSGGTLRHASIAAYVLYMLFEHERGGPCRALGSDALIATSRSFRYADVAVTYDERDTADLGARTLAHPKLIVEVLSESTASIDRGDKLDEYRTIDTLEENILIDSRRRWVETYRRTSEGWIVSLPVAQGELTLTSLGMTLDIDDIYATSVL